MLDTKLLEIQKKIFAISQWIYLGFNLSTSKIKKI